MLGLKMNYKDDDFEGDRKWSQQINDDGTSSFEDQTTYSTVGDDYGATDINKTNAAIMGFVSCGTQISPDGKTVTETDSYGNQLITVFSSDGSSINQELHDAGGTVLASKTTSFSSDGKTITEEANIQ